MTYRSTVTPEEQAELIDAIEALRDFNLPDRLRGLRRLVPPPGSAIADVTVTLVAKDDSRPPQDAAPFCPVPIRGEPLSSTILSERR